jgi:type IV pilus assembly protein PilY1
MLQLRSLKSRAIVWLASVLFAPAMLHAQSTSNLKEDFTGASTNSNWFFYNGACLTAGNGASLVQPGPVPGCVPTVFGTYYNVADPVSGKASEPTLTGGDAGYLGASSSPATADPIGSGALRFTNGAPYGYHQNGAIVSGTTFPTGQGVQVTFKTVTYLGDSGGGGKDGADGISFYLLDGCMPLAGATLDPTCASTSNPIYGSNTFPGIGAWGGSLAYTCSNANPPYDGLVGAYLGLGIDEYGNFLNGITNTLGEMGSTDTGGDNTASGGLYQPGRIGLRGAGSVSWAALTSAYGTAPASGSAPYYPASLASTCSNGGTYNAATKTCGPVCTVAGSFYAPTTNTCDTCAAGTTFYSGTGTCNSCPSGSYNVNTNTCDNTGTCPVGGYVSGGTCNPAGTCSVGTYVSSTNTCNTCSVGTYNPGTNQCYTCPVGSYVVGGTCSPLGTCSVGTYNSSTNQCDTCASGSVDVSTGTGYCNNICASGFAYVSGTNKTYPNFCFKCSNGNSHLQTNGSGVESCSSGGSLTNAKFVPATTSSPTPNNPNAGTPPVKNASIPNNPLPIAPTAKAPSTSTPSTGVPIALLATQKTCKTGRLYNYSTASAPTDAGAATLPTDPSNPNLLNTAKLLDYAALPSAYKVLPSTVKIAAEGAKTRGAASPIFYNLKITQDGLLSLSYSIAGAAYTSVINKLDITKFNGPIPGSFRFGFAGSTGGSNNIHEIMCFQAAPDTLSASSAGVNEKQTSKIDNGTQAYFAYYDPLDSTGRVAAFGLGTDSTGNLTISTQANWDASCVLTGVASGSTCLNTGVAGPTSAQDPTARVMLTWNGTQGVPFEWTSGISTAQQTLLGSANLLSYLRGDRTNEVGNLGVGSFRRRDAVLADIIDSSPRWVGSPIAGYSAAFQDLLNASDPLPENASSAQTYVAFQTTYKTRQNVVYVGSNDGFLHGFRTEAADKSGLNDGKEVLAYMPSGVVQTIHNTTDSTLDFTSTSYGHSYFVDATPGSGDLFYGGKWHTWLVGGLGDGGAGIYALDITDPGSFSEGKASTLVIGDWVAGNDATAGSVSCLGNGITNNANCGVNLGKTFDTPMIRRLHNGMWAVIFGNGTGSATGDAGIYVMTINASTGAKTFYYLSAGVGTVSSPSTDGIMATQWADLDGDHVLDYVYAGDIKGNLWRFDLTSSDPTQWAATTTPVFKTAAGQPITTQVIVGGSSSPTGRRVLVGFGTGMKTSMTNSSPTTYLTTSQSLYGVWDWNMSSWNAQSGQKFASLGSAATGLASGYVQPANLAVVPITINATTGDHMAPNTPICYKGATDCGAGLNINFGYSIALPESNSQGSEQIVFNPQLIDGVFTVNSVLPANNVPSSCKLVTDAGWSYGFDFTDGGSVNFFVGHDGAIGKRNDAVGMSAFASTANGFYMLYQTSGGDRKDDKVKPPANVQANRLTWIQLR